MKIYPGSGGTFTSNGKSFSFDIPEQTIDTSFPFKITLSGKNVSIQPGTVNNLIPKIGSDLLIKSPAPTLEISTDTDQYIYVKCGPDGDNLVFPSNNTVSSGYPEIMVSGTALKNDDSNGYLLLGTITEKGTKISQFIQNSIGAERHKFSQPNSSVYYFWRI